MTLDTDYLEKEKNRLQKKVDDLEKTNRFVDYFYPLLAIVAIAITGAVVETTTKSRDFAANIERQLRSYTEVARCINQPQREDTENIFCISTCYKDNLTRSLELNVSFEYAHALAKRNCQL